MSRQLRRSGLGGLSALLLATAVILAVAGLTRMPFFALSGPAHSPAPHTPAEHSVRPAAIEPEAGPVEPPQPEVSSAPDEQLDAPTAAALDRLAAELGGYRSALAERERLLAAREAVLTTLEAHVAEEVTQLEAASAELKRSVGEVAAEERARIAQLVKVYEAMKAKNAAAIFDPMPLELLLPIVRGMRETKVAAIVAEMDPVKARALTIELAQAGGGAAAR